MMDITDQKGNDLWPQDGNGCPVLGMVLCFLLSGVVLIPHPFKQWLWRRRRQFNLRGQRVYGGMAPTAWFVHY